MELIVRPRAAGKTYDLVQRVLAETDAVLVVTHYGQERNLVERHPELKGKVVCLANASRFLKGRRPKVYVDNVDDVLRAVLGTDIDGGSVTGSEATITL